MGRRIRIWTAGDLYHVTLNCIDWMFLLKPSPELNQILGASLGRALEKYEVCIHSFTTNINHLEFIFSLHPNQVKNASNFLGLFDSLVAKELNRLYGREGHFWSCRAKVEKILNDNKAEDLMAYGACNAVKDGLVERASEWTGFSTTQVLAEGGKLSFAFVNRALWWKHGADHREVDPAKYMQQVSINLTPLPSWEGMTQEARQGRFRSLIAKGEEEALKKRLAEGLVQVKGMARCSQESPFSKPQRRRQRSPQPLCHASSTAEYDAYEREYREIVDAYRRASTAYRQGDEKAAFPLGTIRPPRLDPVLGRAA